MLGPEQKTNSQKQWAVDAWRTENPLVEAFILTFDPARAYDTGPNKIVDGREPLRPGTKLYWLDPELQVFIPISQAA